ncbi:saposin domain-containing protein [Amycolatopsis rubida]|uniref:Saposin-like type B, region 2 n=1 Tax=Amycolatopsis rubida TaxID=112413 RepID=A0A1I6AI22_9PSEU|nr:saposin domain-containing protein [Amycolatopsis rubida]SFQ68346.1 Saposin-like type B, region 2 [Amycolatopsis rubida]
MRARTAWTAMCLAAVLALAAGPVASAATGARSAATARTAVPSGPAAATGEACAFCEYFLHYLTTALDGSTNPERIATMISNACNWLPESEQGKCRELLETYGGAVAALLENGVPEDEICGALGLCAAPGRESPSRRGCAAVAT